MVEVPLPACCPHCGGEVEETGVVSQYQTEIPEPRVERIEFRIHQGRCRRCRRPVEGRDRRQSSQAVGSAASQVGPRAVALAVELNKGLGLAYGKAAAVLGEGFDGFLVRDGWSVYRQFTQALHQTCLAHLLRRCREMILVAGTPGAEFPRAVQTLLQSSLDLRDRRDRSQISPHGLAVARGQLEARLDRVLERRTRSPANRRWRNHLARERDAVFTFLYCPGLEATNWRAEPALRPMVVARKVWGGNRTANGARTQSILLRLLETCRQHQRPVLPLLERLLCSPRPRVWDLTTSRPR